MNTPLDGLRLYSFSDHGNNRIPKATVQRRLIENNRNSTTCPQGSLPRCMLGYHPPPREQTLPEADLPPPGADPPPMEQTPTVLPPRRLLLRTVRILLECILVQANCCLKVHKTHLQVSIANFGIKFECSFRKKHFRALWG